MGYHLHPWDSEKCQCCSTGFLAQLALTFCVFSLCLFLDTMPMYLFCKWVYKINSAALPWNMTFLSWLSEYSFWIYNICIVYFLFDLQRNNIIPAVFDSMVLQNANTSLSQTSPVDVFHITDDVLVLLDPFYLAVIPTSLINKNISLKRWRANRKSDTHFFFF